MSTATIPTVDAELTVDRPSEVRDLEGTARAVARDTPLARNQSLLPRDDLVRRRGSHKHRVAQAVHWSTTSRLWRPFALGMALLVAAETLWLAISLSLPGQGWSLGMDAAYYRELAARYLSTGQFYLPAQLEGPYEPSLLGIMPGLASVLYPPHVLFLFVPFSLMPEVLWWAVPVVIMVWAAWRWKPAAWAVGLALLLLAWPRAIGAYLFGNTDMWLAAAIAAGLSRGWPAALVTIKPTLLPFAILAIRWRHWWALVPLGLGALALMWPLWLEYVTAMRNLQGLGLTYSLGSLPLMLVPVVLWAGRRREAKSGGDPLPASPGR